ncbi:hypothetical protein [Daejeonella rubra]|uniref:hypothetical protein n=1 Tax=Daejeonella rubra TaxID=990371 RepID=UPI000B89B0AE|nr:hypothetical protein [Daejeonella rubra]
MFRSGRLGFGLKPDLKIGSSPGAKAPGYYAIWIFHHSVLYSISSITHHPLSSHTLIDGEHFNKFTGILALKHHYLFRSGHLGFGLKPDLKIGSSPGAKAPGYYAIWIFHHSVYFIQS